MNWEKLEQLIRLSGKSKTQIADECGISRPTVDSAMTGADVKVSTVEAIAKTLNVRVGDLFDDPPSVPQTVAQTMTTINQSGGSNTQAADPSPVWEQLREKDRQIAALLDIIGKFSASLPAPGEPR